MTSLLSLPNELLLQIASEIAPLGGKEAANLRLVCHRLDALVSPIVWSALSFSAQSERRLGGLQAAFFRNPLSGAFTTSVKISIKKGANEVTTAILATLPLLKRLHLCGLHGDGPIPAAIFDLIPSLRLTSLTLEHIVVESHGDFTTWGVGIETLTLRACFEASREDKWAGYTAMSVTLEGHPAHFLASTAARPNTASHAVVTLLNWIGDALETLDLSSGKGFEVSDELLRLSLRRLTSLTLSASVDDHDDILTLDTYGHLVRLLNPTSFPALTSLSLRGWLDSTDVETLSHHSIVDLIDLHNALYLLLDFLRSTTICELRLENSEVHERWDVRCIFERVGNGEWEMRVVRFW
ncbi:hypothetical protein RQP46_010468 [Phenoliferia psychrophenolica]